MAKILQNTSKFKTVVTLLVVFLVLVYILGKTSKSYWADEMSNFVEPLKKFYSIDLNKKVYTEQEKKLLKESIRGFQNTGHGLRFSVLNFFSKTDPAIEADYKYFLENLKTAEKALDHSAIQGISYTKNAINHCAFCHSKGGRSTNLFKQIKNVKVSNYEKGRLSLALRDFSMSEKIYRDLLLKREPEDYYYDHIDVLVGYLNATILNRTDKNIIIKSVQTYINNLGTEAVKKDVEAILINIKNYKLLIDYQKALGEFRGLPSKDRERDQKIYTLLNIKNILHMSLSKVTNKATKAEIYAALGDIYSGYPELSVFTVPQSYYEYCIKEDPKSVISKGCFAKYSNQIALSYTDSFKVDMPSFEKEKIDKLRSIAY